MKALNNMTREERSLLLFLETRYVDYAGRVDTRHMNEPDMQIVDAWVEEGFIEFGRIASQDVTRQGGHWVKIPLPAFTLAGAERMARAKRMQVDKGYQTTAEKRECGPVKSPSGQKETTRRGAP